MVQYTLSGPTSLSIWTLKLFADELKKILGYQDDPYYDDVLEEKTRTAVKMANLYFTSINRGKNPNMRRQRQGRRNYQHDQSMSIMAMNRQQQYVAVDLELVEKLKKRALDTLAEIRQKEKLL